MASPTGDTADAAQLTARGHDSWDADIFGSPAHPLIGPTGAPGYWDRKSIAAAPTSPDALRNCTFITISPPYESAIYYGPTCPPIPQNPFAGAAYWIGDLGPLMVLVLGMAGTAIKVKLEEADPEATWDEWARRAWRAVVAWMWSWTWVEAVRARWAREERVGARRARARRLPRTVVPTVVDEREGEYVRTCDGGQVRCATDASATTGVEGLCKQREEVQWWRWTESTESTKSSDTGSGYMLVDAAGAPSPATLAPPKDEEQDEDGAPPPPYSTKTGSSARWS